MGSKYTCNITRALFYPMYVVQTILYHHIN
uniref:Uncharacterized protein n=1 Tax=Ackermannviridae sp. ctClB2 TaxID=2825752 RepID=A0A8S5NZD0_9CAUD|nr:MAG TPA: hypothetical protein [Ackermannviridae sp. ctClB2]